MQERKSLAAEATSSEASSQHVLHRRALVEALRVLAANIMLGGVLDQRAEAAPGSRHRRRRSGHVLANRGDPGHAPLVAQKRATPVHVLAALAERVRIVPSKCGLMCPAPSDPGRGPHIRVAVEEVEPAVADDLRGPTSQTRGRSRSPNETSPRGCQYPMRSGESLEDSRWRGPTRSAPAALQACPVLPWKGPDAPGRSRHRAMPSCFCSICCCSA